MNQPGPYSEQLLSAQDDAIRRLRAVRFCGVFDGGLVVMNDDGLHHTSFSLVPNQTLGEALDEVDRRFQEVPDVPTR